MRHRHVWCSLDIRNCKTRDVVPYFLKILTKKIYIYIYISISSRFINWFHCFDNVTQYN